MERLIRERDKILKRVNGQKTAMVSRYGAMGDMILVTPILRKLKAEGYFVILNTHHSSAVIVTNNPYIDAKLLQKPNEIPVEELEEYWEVISEGIDKFVNLSGSIENELLKVEGSFEFYLPKEDREKLCNKNYMNYTMEKAGYNDKGCKPELYFSKKEHEWAQSTMKRLKDKYVVLWSLSGSSMHKVWPYTEQTACEFLEMHPNAHVIAVGDRLCKILEWEHPRTWSWSDDITVRKAMLLTKYVDLVIGTETGIMNAASCFDTPKIVMLSHSSVENLSKYWTNCESVSGNVHCQPCHQLHYTRKSCPLNSASDTPLCMTMIRPEQVLIRMEKFYKESRRKVA